MAYQDDVLSGPIDEGLEIGSGDDNDLEKLAAGVTLERGPTRA